MRLLATEGGKRFRRLQVLVCQKLPRLGIGRRSPVEGRPGEGGGGGGGGREASNRVILAIPGLGLLKTIVENYSILVEVRDAQFKGVHGKGYTDLNGLLEVVRIGGGRGGRGRGGWGEWGRWGDCDKGIESVAVLVCLTWRC